MTCYLNCLVIQNLRGGAMIVYRLEDEDGRGPFSGSQDVIHLLTEHHDPEKMLKQAGLNRKAFNRLCTAGWKFGRATRQLADEFFVSKEGRKQAKTRGFDFVEKRAKKYVVFPDGQVLFKE